MTTPPDSAAPSPQDVLRRLVGPGEKSALDALRNVATEPTEIEDFRPLGQCLEWRLADAYWDRGGVIPFVRNDVPYLVNNTGRLSENAAVLVFAALGEIRPALPERIVVSSSAREPACTRATFWMLSPPNAARTAATSTID
jgi:hypothetical protein